jgi:hypothetical protein
VQRPLGKLFGLVTGTYATRRSLRGGPGHHGPPSDHFDGEVFRNLDPTASAGRSLGDFLRWQRSSRAAPWPAWVENSATPQLPSRLGPGELALTFINHITFLLQVPGLNLPTDPVYSERVSPVPWSGPKRVRAHLDLGARTSVGTHYGCFQLTDEGIDEPLHALEVARRRHGVSTARFRALDTGATLRLDRRPS